MSQPNPAGVLTPVAPLPVLIATCIAMLLIGLACVHLPAQINYFAPDM